MEGQDVAPAQSALSEACANATVNYIREVIRNMGIAVRDDDDDDENYYYDSGAGSRRRSKAGVGYYDDSANSYKYIIFVLVVYAVSFMALMVKYFWKSHEGKKFENLYEEYVKRDNFKDNSFDLRTGRRGPMSMAVGEALVTGHVPLAAAPVGIGVVGIPKRNISFEEEDANTTADEDAAAASEDGLEVVAVDFVNEALEASSVDTAGKNLSRHNNSNPY